MSKKGKIIYIPPDPISRKEILDQVDRYRISQYQFQLETIRTSDLSEDQKRIQSSFILSRIQSIEASRERS